MYEAPIQITYGQIKKMMEDGVLRAVQSYGVKVDKPELLRALQYDRGQYEKGRQEGRAEVVHRIRRYLLCLLEEWQRMDPDRKYRLENMRVYNHIRKELDELEALGEELLLEIVKGE
jgi:hypothetical protein